VRRIALTALLACTAALAAAPVAAGATRVVVRGAGFGHGIGMSQYGAFGFAQKGVGYERILKHYYRGTRLSQAPSRPVRVLLQASDPYVRIRGATRGPGGRRLNPGTTYVVRRASGGRLSLAGGGKRVGRFRSPLRVTGRVMRLLGPAINGIRNGLYRSSFELRPGAAGGVTAINSLPIDSYVQGVVPGEMPADWAFGALRAQAVTARTYALATRKTDDIFDVYPDTRSQVYRGVNGERGRSNQAVRDTAGQILTYNGDPAVTFYFSTSGGRTENVELSFLGAQPRPWLKSVKDPYDGISPKHRWRQSFSAAVLGARLGARGRYRKIRVLKRGRSPRIVRARVYGSRGSRVLTGAQIRARLGLFDSWARFTTVRSSQVRPVRSARRARVARSGPPYAIAGVFDPAPRGSRLVLERRRGDGWQRVRETLAAADGRFRARVPSRGTYRVRAGVIAGPAVRVR
jgi:stage II sporulation protein D